MTLNGQLYSPLRSRGQLLKKDCGIYIYPWKKITISTARIAKSFIASPLDSFLPCSFLHFEILEDGVGLDEKSGATEHKTEKAQKFIFSGFADHAVCL